MSEQHFQSANACPLSSRKKHNHPGTPVTLLLLLLTEVSGRADERTVKMKGIRDFVLSSYSVYSTISGNSNWRIRYLASILQDIHNNLCKAGYQVSYSTVTKYVRDRKAELETLDFIKTGQNVIMYGNPGTGKSHCAIGLGVKACLAGYSVLFASVPRMLVEIKESESKRKLSRLQKKFEKYDLAILDECGYKSLDKVAAEHLFNHISLRAGMKSTIITTNLGFDRWDEIFTDKIIAAAIVDRLTFKSFIIDMNGPSYRLKATEQWINERKNTDKRHK